MKILGLDYKVLSVSDEDIGDPLGLCCHAKQLIKIKASQHPQQFTSTLLHEIIEAINAQLDLKMKHNQVCGLETGIYAVLTENGVDLSPLNARVD